MHLIKKIKKIISNKEIFQDKDKDLIYILKTKINTATDSITIVSTKTSLNIVFITL